MRTNNLIVSAVMAALNSEATQGGTVDLDLARAAVEADAPETDQDKQERKERLEKVTAQAVKAAQDGTAMPDELIGLANREIKECWKMFADKGGVWDLSKQVKRGLSNISAHILTIAKECAAHAWKRCEGQPDADFTKLAGAMFRNAMATAELSLRGSLDLADEEAEEKLDAFLTGSWNVYKSQVKAGYDAGFDPRDMESIYAITQAVRAAKTAKNPGTRAESTPAEQPAQQGEGSEETGGDTDESEETHQPIEETAEIVAGGSAIIASALILLHRAVNSVDLDAPKNEERVANILSVATREINKLTRKIEQQDAGSDDHIQGLDDLMPAKEA